MAHLTTGRKLGPLTITRLLGSGGMADVYEARDTRLDRRVAVKVLPELQRRSGDFLGRFQREIRACASLSHVHIVTVYDSGVSEGLHYYTMALLEGGDLRQRMREGLSEADVREIMRAVLRAFEHAHARGFVHRDVKPENILFDSHGTPVLTDFGIAKMLGAETQMTQTGMAMGTPRYISPEQASGRDVDGRSDLYSLGCVLYEMLSGQLPYKADTPIGAIYQHISAPIPRLPARYAHWQEFLDKLMAKAPELRYQSAPEVLEALSRVMIPRTTGGVNEGGFGTDGNRVVTPVFVQSTTPSAGTPARQAEAAYSATEVLPAAAAATKRDQPRSAPARGWLRAVLALGSGLVVALLATLGLRFIPSVLTETPSRPESTAVSTEMPSVKPQLGTLEPRTSVASEVALGPDIPLASVAPARVVATVTPAPNPTLLPTATAAVAATSTPTKTPTAEPSPTPTAKPTPSPTPSLAPKIAQKLIPAATVAAPVIAPGSAATSQKSKPRPTAAKAVDVTLPPKPTLIEPSAEARAQQRRRALEDQLRGEEAQAQRVALEARLQAIEDAVRDSRALEDELRREEQEAQMNSDGNIRKWEGQFAADDRRISETRTLEDELRREEAFAQRLELEGKFERIESWVKRQRAAEDAAAAAAAVSPAPSNIDINQ